MSRKRTFPAGRFLDRIVLGLLIVSRVGFTGAVLFLKAVGVKKYTTTAVCQSKNGCKLYASCVLREQRVLHARGALVQAGWWRWAWPKAA